MISIPFSGSKKFSYKNVRKIVEEGNYKRVYEPFGGSCVLSVNLVNDDVVEYAVANDYDHFFDLYPEYLDLKDKVVEEGYKKKLRRTVKNTKGSWRINPDGSRTKLKSRILNNDDKKILQDIILKYVQKDYWFYFANDSNFTYSAFNGNKEIKLNNFCMFDAHLQTDKQREYLKALSKIKLEHYDYKRFLEIYKWEIQDDPNALLIIDPPYIGTNQGQYKGGFSISQTVELLELLKELNVDFIFFNHDPDVVKDLLEDFDYSLELTGKRTATANKNRKDVMAYVKQINN